MEYNIGIFNNISDDIKFQNTVGPRYYVNIKKRFAIYMLSERRKSANNEYQTQFTNNKNGNYRGPPVFWSKFLKILHSCIVITMSHNAFCHLSTNNMNVKFDSQICRLVNFYWK